MKHFIALFFAVLAPSALFAQSENWLEVNLAVTDHQVIPAYAAFSESATGLARASEAFCRQPDADSLETFRQGFNDSMDDWQQIQHIQFGPITYFNWNFRLQYWPDEKGTGARQLDALIAGKDTARLEIETFARESVGVQGFPALERLLFGEDGLLKLQQDAFRCRVAQTIAANIGDIAAGVSERWPDEFRTTIENADERGFFESSQDATIEFLKAQVESVRRIQQQKLEAVLGETADQVRTRRAESWRSMRSLRNIRFNVLALEQLFNGVPGQDVALNAVLLPDDVDIINGIFPALQESLDSLPDSYEAALAMDGGYKKLQEVVSQFDALFEAFEAAVKNTDLYLGFNSLDGD